jgi:hypothetical protein
MLDDLTDAVIAGGFPRLFPGNGVDLAMNGGDRAWRGLIAWSIDKHREELVSRQADTRNGHALTALLSIGSLVV